MGHHDAMASKRLFLIKKIVIEKLLSFTRLSSIFHHRVKPLLIPAFLFGQLLIVSESRGQGSVDLVALRWSRSGNHPDSIKHGDRSRQTMVMPTDPLQLVIHPIQPKCSALLVAIRQQGVDPRIKRGVWIGPFNELHLDHQIILIVQPKADTWMPVSTGSANLLVIGFDRTRCLRVDDDSNIFFVDSHPESVCGADDLDVAFGADAREPRQVGRGNPGNGLMPAGWSGLSWLYPTRATDPCPASEQGVDL